MFNIRKVIFEIKKNTESIICSSVVPFQVNFFQGCVKRLHFLQVRDVRANTTEKCLHIFYFVNWHLPVVS